jgi:hypothetical protein
MFMDQAQESLLSTMRILKWSETGDLDMIECADGAKTIVKLRSAKSRLFAVAGGAGPGMGSKGNARKYTGTRGEMWQLGLLNMGRTNQ